MECNCSWEITYYAIRRASGNETVIQLNAWKRERFLYLGTVVEEEDGCRSTDKKYCKYARMQPALLIRLRGVFLTLHNSCSVLPMSCCYFASWCLYLRDTKRQIVTSSNFNVRTLSGWLFTQRNVWFHFVNKPNWTFASMSRSLANY